jgi:tRNA nucleotidyltransferase (CCA-adding enzyme)
LIYKLDKTAARYSKIRRMVEYIIKRVLPEYQELAQFTHNNPYHYTDVFTHTVDMLFMADTDDIEVLLTVLFHDIGKMKARVFNEKRLTNHYYNHEAASADMTRDMMERLRFDNSTIERVVRLVSVHDYLIRPNRRCAKKLLQKLGLELCVKLTQFQLLDKAAHRWETSDAYDEWTAGVAQMTELWQEIIENNEAFNIRDLAINGHDLMEMGFVQGKALGDALALCLDYVIEYPERNSKADLVEYIAHTNKCGSDG